MTKETWKLIIAYGGFYVVADASGKEILTGMNSAHLKDKAREIARARGVEVEFITVEE